MKNIRNTLTAIMFILILSACTSTPQENIKVDPSPPVEEEVTLRIAVLPILDNLPMYVAEAEGLFDKYNINVEFIPVSSAAERDQVIVAEQADGLINELVSALLYNQQNIQIQVVRFARIATPTSPQFYILASGQSGITTAAQLKGVEIGISEGTVIEYVTDRLLAAEGLTADEIVTVAVPRMDLRMTLLSSGELSAATLPDPLSLLAEQQGAVVVLDDSNHPELSYSTFSFRKPFIDAHSDAVRAFLSAIEEATQLVNNNPDKYENLLVDKKLVPAPLIETYQVPEYPTASIPSLEQWNDVLEWARQEGLVSNEVSYDASVTGIYLP
jgi:NitT/TauT family transport system substrate-binding protein